MSADTPDSPANSAGGDDDGQTAYDRAQQTRAFGEQLHPANAARQHYLSLGFKLGSADPRTERVAGPPGDLDAVEPEALVDEWVPDNDPLRAAFSPAEPGSQWHELIANGEVDLPHKN